MLRQWLELTTTHLLGLNRPASTVDGYRPDVEQCFAFCERRRLMPLEVTRMHPLSRLAVLGPAGISHSSGAQDGRHQGVLSVGHATTWWWSCCYGERLGGRDA